MKKAITLILVLISFYTYAQNNINTIKVTYTHTAHKSGFLQKGAYVFDTELLIIKDSVSQYSLNKKEKIIRKDNYQMTMVKYKYISNYYYKNDSIEDQRELQKGVKIKAKWKADYNWEISNDTKTIKGFEVRKATTNSIEIDPDKPGYFGKAIAWFTEEIPIPSGPNRYCGLPGLILELEYEGSIKKTTLKSIEFNPEIKILDISEGVVLEDKRDLVYYIHNNSRKVKKAIKKQSKKVRVCLANYVEIKRNK